ncbi:MAG TPA: hypothetical protein VLJ39_04915, partial [Tepidisphaeraceae bacterium]|nr:hypothetical protein [Tepidisphaeraceae bacterium]
KGLRGYLCWVDGTEWSILGNTVANTTRQHVVRGNSTAINAVLIHDNDFSKEMQPDDPGETWKTTINFRSGNYVYISGNKLNDSTVSFTIGPNMTTDEDTNWIVLEDNDFRNTQLQFNETVHHVMVRNNYFDMSWGAQIVLMPGILSDAYGHLTDVTITGNTGVSTGTNGQFLQVTGQMAPGTITLTQNLFIAPNLQLGWSSSAAVLVQAPDLSGFAQIADNIWPAPVTTTQGVAGVVNYVAGYASPTNYLTPAQWDAQNGVDNDQFTNAALSSGVYQLTINGVTAGAAGLSLAA